MDRPQLNSLPAQMKTIIFARSVAGCDPRGRYVDLSVVEDSRQSDIDQTVDWNGVLSQFGKEWFNRFSAWMGALNRRNAGLLWWAHTSTAKNLLSSPLGERFIQVLAICEIAKREDIRILNIVGATPGQMEVIARVLPAHAFHITGRAWRARRWIRAAGNLGAIARVLIQGGRALRGSFGYRPQHVTKPLGLCLFTYLDGVYRAGFDNYFGRLAEILRSLDPDFSIVYLAYVYKPYQKRLREIGVQQQNSVPYIALFGLLRLGDHLWALLCTFREWWRNSRHTAAYPGVDEYESLLYEIFVHDLAVGNYVDHLLVYRATRRFINDYAPRMMMYPFENKSVEKMVLSAIRDAGQTKTIGYQHSSVTPRHSTFLFSPGEAAVTPLPDKIFTVGKVTRHYLETRGNYPFGIFETGVALRQTWGERLPRQRTDKERVLLALSSSKSELIRSVMFAQRVMRHRPRVELGIRPHINFPLSLLPRALAEWVAQNASDFTGTSLHDNLHWCSVTAYVSSTVALETLMLGKPVINMSVGDVVSPDPVLGDAPFRWHVRNETEMADVLGRLREMSDIEYDQASAAAIDYARDYLAPVNDVCIEAIAAAVRSA